MRKHKHPRDVARSIIQTTREWLLQRPQPCTGFTAKRDAQLEHYCERCGWTHQFHDDDAPDQWAKTTMPMHYHREDKSCSG